MVIMQKNAKVNAREKDEMGRFKYNPLREEWNEKVMNWLGVYAMEVTPRALCPRCGLTIRESDYCDYSQYYPDMVICENCLHDEILRDSVGKDQADISRWFISTRRKLSYMFDEDNNREDK